jgi:Orsellinic acid/F9775 biosynthesis cluster protein D
VESSTPLPNIFLDIDVDMEEIFSPYVPTPPSSPAPLPADDDMDTSPRRLTARQKGKGKEIEMPSSALPPLLLAPSMPQPPLAPPNLSTASDGSTLMPKDADFSTLAIQYHSSEILTSHALNLINCVLYIPLRIIICVVCGIAVQPRSIRRHRQGEPHLDCPAISQAEVDSIVALNEVFLEDVLVCPALPLPIVPGIQFTRGWSCTFPNCAHSRKSRKKMANHIIDIHGSSIKQWEPLQCNVQSIFESNASYYLVEMPPGPSSSPIPTMPDPLGLLFSTYQDITSKISHTVSNDSAHLSPFLAKYKWHEIVGDTLPLDIKGWISAPQDTEPELLGLTTGVKLYYSKIVETMGEGEAWTTVLRWVNTSKL